MGMSGELEPAVPWFCWVNSQGHFLGLSTGFRASWGGLDGEGQLGSEWLPGQGGWRAAFLGAGMQHHVR